MERYPTALPLPQLCDWHLINKVLTSGLENQNTVSALTVRTALPIVETVLLSKWKSASWTNTAAIRKVGSDSEHREASLFICFLILIRERERVSGVFSDSHLNSLVIIY